MLDYTDRLSSSTTMGYVFPLVRTIHVTDLNTDDYYEMCVIEEDFLQEI